MERPSRGHPPSMMSPRFFFAPVFVSVVSLVVACGGETVNVGSTSQMELRKRADGSATGDGQTCSWDGVVASDVNGNTSSAPDSGGEYRIGDQFASLDGCNSCACTKDGIACTTKACASPPGGQPCQDDAKVCPDGTAVGRTGPSCEFAPCPGEGESCPAIARICNDGQTAKSGPDCAQICPEDGDVACTDDAKLCPDGKTYVGRQGPSCEFAPCPS